jgi:DNA ligase (NAD+)
VADMTKKKYLETLEILRNAARAYYDSEHLIIDDETYDALWRQAHDSFEKHPEWGGEEVFRAVAAGSSAGGGVSHKRAMLSLDNAYSDEDVVAWHDRMERACGRQVTELCVEPKLDGLALSAWYEMGRLVQIATRGDGVTGEDVTVHAAEINGLPQVLSQKMTLEIRGECVMTSEQFLKANERRTQAGEREFANPRNAVAGVIRRKEAGSHVSMTFAAYGAFDTPRGESENHSALMSWLEKLGVGTAIGMARKMGAGKSANLADAIESSNKIARERSSIDCGIDGVVIKADRPMDRSDAGETGKAPRWAIARKFPADTRTTVLSGIECAVGRTGALTVRAILEPVSVGGVTITSCTLSNPSEIARKDLRIGDTVWVRRAGEVIPEITSVALDKRPKSAKSWKAPANCPRCQSTLDTTQRVWRCPKGRTCGAFEALLYAVGRDALDIEGMGEKLLRQLVESGRVATVADLYTLKEIELSSLERMGDTSAKNVIAEIELSKELPFSRVLCALGIRGTGRRMCLRLAQSYPEFNDLEKATKEDLASIEGIGEIKAEQIVAELAELSLVVAELKKLKVGRREVIKETKEGPLSGKNVCVTGTITGMTRDEAQESVVKLGGKAVSGVNSKTDLLVVGDGGGGKRAKAIELGVKTITGEEFIEMLSGIS